MPAAVAVCPAPHLHRVKDATDRTASAWPLVLARTARRGLRRCAPFIPERAGSTWKGCPPCSWTWPRRGTRASSG